MTNKNGKYRINGLEKGGKLEKYVGNSNGIFDAQIAEVINIFGKFVCQIIRESATGYLSVGTGFLIGPSLVLTNYHVVENTSTHNLYCRFDVKSVGVGKFNAGPLVKVSDILATSPYSEIEASGRYSKRSDEHPDLSELDYAVLKIENLDEDIRNTSSSSSVVPRGWLSLPDTAPDIEPNSPVYILQHPKGGALKVASDAFAEHQPVNGARVRYLADTENGSSGSPCFCWSAEDDNGNSTLILVALHNFGDPGSIFRKSEFNHGIPIHLIASELKNYNIGEVFYPDIQNYKNKYFPKNIKQRINTIVTNLISLITLLMVVMYIGLLVDFHNEQQQKGTIKWSLDTVFSLLAFSDLPVENKQSDIVHPDFSREHFGFVHSTYLETIPSTSLGSALKIGAIAKVVVDQLNARSGPGTEFPIVGTFHGGCVIIATLEDSFLPWVGVQKTSCKLEDSQSLGRFPKKFEVILEDAGDLKTNTIKEIVKITGKSLIEAKEIIEKSGSVISITNLESAQKIKESLENMGAKILVREFEDQNSPEIAEDINSIRSRKELSPAVLRELICQLSGRNSEIAQKLLEKAGPESYPSILNWLGIPDKVGCSDYVPEHAYRINLGLLVALTEILEDAGKELTSKLIRTTAMNKEEISILADHPDPTMREKAKKLNQYYERYIVDEVFSVNFFTPLSPSEFEEIYSQMKTKRRITSIILSHTRKPNAADVVKIGDREVISRITANMFHAESSWAGARAHFYISSSGSIIPGRNLNRRPAAVPFGNGTDDEGPIYVELILDGDKEIPPKEQKAAFAALLKVIRDTHNVDIVNDIFQERGFLRSLSASRRGPGKLITGEKIKQWFNEYGNTKQ